jgi:hypothetical protein
MQFLEQPTDVVLVVADPKLLFDHSGHAAAGPYLTPEPVGLRAMPEELRDQAFLSVREFGRPPRTGLSVQRVHSAITDTSEPTTDAHGGDAERLGDVVPRPALLLQVPRSKPSPLQSVRRKGIRDLHTSIVCGEESNSICAAVSSNPSITDKEAPRMPYSNPGAFREQANFLRRQFLQDGDLPFTNVLTEEVIALALTALGGWLDSVDSIMFLRSNSILSHVRAERSAVTWSHTPTTSSARCCNHSSIARKGN